MGQGRFPCNLRLPLSLTDVSERLLKRRAGLREALHHHDVGRFLALHFVSCSEAGPLGAFPATGPSHTLGALLGTNVLETMRDAFVTALLFSGQFILATCRMAHEILLPFRTLALAMLLHLMHPARFRAVLHYLVLFAHLVACAFRFVLQAFQVAAP